MIIHLHNLSYYMLVNGKWGPWMITFCSRLYFLDSTYDGNEVLSCLQYQIYEYFSSFMEIGTCLSFIGTSLYYSYDKYTHTSLINGDFWDSIEAFVWWITIHNKHKRILKTDTSQVWYNPLGKCRVKYSYSSASIPHASISICGLGCCPCPILWGWQRQAMSNTAVACSSDSHSEVTPLSLQNILKWL